MMRQLAQRLLFRNVRFWQNCSSTSRKRNVNLMLSANDVRYLGTEQKAMDQHRRTKLHFEY